MTVYIILAIMAIFTVWNVVYTYNVKKERNSIMSNLDKLNKKDGITNNKGKG